MNKLTALVAASFAIALVACSGDDDDKTASSASALTVVDACSATVSCDFSDGIKHVPLTKDASGCHMGGLTLAAGGAVVADDVHGMVWKSTGTTVSVCVDGAPEVCIDCRTAGAPATTSSAPAKAKCTGSSRSCASLGPGTCGRQDGCSMDLDFENCEGWSKSCDDYDSKISCEGQAGCSWE